MNLERYSRQIPLIGEEGQRKLRRSEVTVVGAGGLGTPLLVYLTCAGVGKIRVIDPGIPKLNNLNRQFLYYSLEKRSKAEIIAEKLEEINPEVSVDPVSERISEDNSEIVGTPDAIVDCLDTFSSRMILNEYSVSKGIPLVHAGVEGFYGQIMTVIPKEGPCLACLFRNLTDKERIPIIGYTAGVLGSMEAAEVINLLLGKPALVGRLLFVDLKEMKIEEIRVERDPNCPICSSKRDLHSTMEKMKSFSKSPCHNAFR